MPERKPGCRLPRWHLDQFSISRRLKAAFREAGSAGWVLDVVEFFPEDVSSGELWSAELREIEWAMTTFGRWCLNTKRARPSYLTCWTRDRR